jgi:hypothetical protein
MRSPSGDKYCAGCEAWHFEHQRPQKQKIGELVPMSKDTDIQLKQTGLQTPYRPSFDYVLNQSVIRCLQTKLYFLSTLLNNESDPSKIRELLSTINICLEDIRLAIAIERGDK